MKANDYKVRQIEDPKLGTRWVVYRRGKEYTRRQNCGAFGVTISYRFSSEAAAMEAIGNIRSLHIKKQGLTEAEVFKGFTED